MKLLVTLAALALAGAAVSDDVVEDTDIDIAIGRLEVINEHTLEIWQKMRADGPRAEGRDLEVMNHSLRNSVWEYNRLREDLCNDRFIVEQSCGAPYLPKWIYDSKQNATTLKELQARQEDLAGHVEPLWDAACARLEKVISHDDWMPYCSIE